MGRFPAVFSHGYRWFVGISLGLTATSLVGGLIVEARFRESPYQIVGVPDTQPLDIRDHVEGAPDQGERFIPYLPLSDAPSSVELVFDDAVDPAVRAEIEGAVGLADRYFRATGAGPLPATTVVASNDPNVLIEELTDREGSGTLAATPEWWRRYRGTHSQGTVYLLTDWIDPDSAASYWQRAEVVEHIVHELAHAMHYSLAGGPASSWATLPNWFTEGAAELEAATALEAFGFGVFDLEKNERQSAARGSASTLETSPTFSGEAYTLGFLALVRLTSDGDLAPVRAIFRSVGDGRPFDSAVEEVTGRSRQEFVQEFETHRANNFPVHAARIQGEVSVTGGTRPQLVVWACPEDSDCHFGYVRPDGTFVLAVPDGRYTLQFSLYSGHEWESPSVYFSSAGAVPDFEDATKFPVFGRTVEGFDLEIPLEMLLP